MLVCAHNVCRTLKPSAGFKCSSLDVSQYALEMEAKLDQLRSLVEAADRDKVELLNQLEEEKRWVV